MWTSFPGSGSSQRILACLSTLHLFAKIRPQLLVNHALTLQPYLSLKCQVSEKLGIVFVYLCFSMFPVNLKETFVTLRVWETSTKGVTILIDVESA